MRRSLLPLILLTCALAVPGGGFTDTIALVRQLTDPATPANAETAASLLSQVTSLSNRLFAGSFTLGADGGAGASDYALSAIFSFAPTGTSVVLQLAATGTPDATVSYAYTGNLSAEAPSLMAHAVFLLWGTLSGRLAGSTVPAPVYVDELQSSLVSPYATPMSIAMLPDGAVLAGMVAASAVLDRSFRILDRPGAGLFDAGITGFALGVSTTPGGTIVFKPAMGREAYRLTPGSQKPQKVSLGVETATSTLVALADGSLLIMDSSKKLATRLLGRQRRDLAIFGSDWSYITAAAAAPDGSLWLYDPAVRGVRIFTPEGVPVDSFLPLVDPAHPIAPYALSVGPDGGVILAATDQVVRCAPDGSVLWRLTALPGAEVSSLPPSAGLAVDWEHGLIYLADPTSRRVVKLLDRSLARARGADVSFEEKVIAARQGDESTRESRLAALYDDAGSFLMARSYWQRVVDADPMDVKAADRLLRLEVEELSAAAHELDAKARSTLSQIGLETARPLSLQAIQKYELLLSKDPGNDPERRAMGSLRDLFAAGGTGGGAPARPLTVAAPNIPALFPALMEWYTTHAAGSVRVTNPLDAAVTDVRARLFIPGLMDLPADSPPAKQLAPGASVSLPLSPAFSQKVLELQEDMVVQAQVTVLWRTAAGEQSVSVTQPVAVHRNSALTWDDTRRIASFITPNEQTISGFAARVLAAGSRADVGLSPRIFQAMRIVEALAARGLTYVPDPDSPITKAFGAADIVDTVRFPRTTLYNRTGDCDDTTALLCSLLESVGIPTAALTSPGHIFMAFDTGEPAENAALFTDDTHGVIRSGATAWIPVETTVLTKGFMAAWEAASALVSTNTRDGTLQIIPVAAMRDSYPALPLPPSVVAIAEPAAAAVDKGYAASMASFTTAMYSVRLAGLKARASSLTGRSAALVQVKEGVLHALFGRRDDAAAAFRAALAADASLVSPYVNLANLRLLAADRPGALAFVTRGLSRNGDSVLLNLLAARIYADQGDSARAGLHLAVAQKADPALAGRLDSLGTIRASAQRGAGADEHPSLIWSEDR